VQDFNATIRIDAEPRLISEPQTLGQKTEVLPVADSVPSQQSGVKTEVFGGDFGAADYLQNNQTTSPQNFATEDFGAKTNETPSAPPIFTGDQTVPFIGYENQTNNVDFAQTQPASAFNSIPQVENFGSTAETRLPTNDYSPVDQSFSQPVQNTNPPIQRQPIQPKPEKKKSKGLVFAVIGGLFGLLILAAAAAGIGWYMYNNNNAGIANVATPTPEPTISATPTPEPTPDQANANIGNTSSNSNTQVVTTNSPDNSAVNSTANVAPSPDKTEPIGTTETPVTQPTKPGTTPRPTQTTVITPRPQLPKTPKPTGKPETKPTLRGTTIPQ
jgi:hypothetical protein